MRSLSIIPLLAVYALGQPTGGCLKWGNFTAIDSINGMAMIGSFSGGGLGFLRINADENGCEFVVPTGTDLPVNQRDPALLGHATADTMTINVANITVLNTDSTVNNISQTTDTATINDELVLEYATANTDAVFDANKKVVSNAVTGTGNSVRADGGHLSQVNIGSSVNTTNLRPLEVKVGIAGPAPVFRMTNTTGIINRPLEVDFAFLNSNSDLETYSRISGNATNTTDGSEAGEIKLATMVSGTLTEGFRLGAGGVVIPRPATLQSTLAVTGASTFTGLMSPTRINIGGSDPSSLYANPTTTALVPYFQRQSDGDGSSGVRASLRLSTATDAAISDGFGSDILLQIREGAANPATIASVGVGREANNTSGRFRVNVYNNGTAIERYTISRSGEHVFTGNTTTTGSATATRFQSGTGTSVFDTAQIDVLDVGDITGAGLFGDSLTVDSALVLANLSANSPLYLDGNNEVKTGTWSGTGTVIPTTQGATLNNPTLTGTVTTPTAITMGSNTFTRSGAHNLTLTTGASTNVTLPASGTLYGTATGSITSAQLATSLTNESGTGLVVFNNGSTINELNLTGQTDAAKIVSTDTVAASLGLRSAHLSISGSVPSAGISVFSSQITTGAVHNTSIRVDNSYSGGLPRNAVSGIHVTVTDNDGVADTVAGVYIGGVAGGHAIMSPTNAPSYFGGGVTVAGPLTTRKSVARKVEYWTAGYSPLTLDETMHYVGHGNPVTGDLVVNLPPLGSGAILGREYVLFVNRFDGSGGDATMTIVADGTDQIWWTSTIPASSISIGSGFSHWAVTLVAGSSHWFVVNASKF